MSSRPLRPPAAAAAPGAGTLVLLLAAFALAALGQWSFASGARFLFDGLFLYGCGISAFVLAMADEPRGRPPVRRTVRRTVWWTTRRTARTTAPPERAGSPSPSWRRWAFSGLAAIAAATLLGIRDGDPSDVEIAIAVAAWVTTIAASLAAVGVFGERDETGGTGDVPWTKRVDLAWVAGLTIAALALRVPLLDTIPRNLSGDEAGWGLDAARVVRGELRDPFRFGWWGQPTLAYFAAAPSLALLGITPLGLRLPWALVGSLTPGLVYLLGARLWGRSVGAAAGILLAGWSFDVHFSRVGHLMSPGGMLATAAVLLFLRARASAPGSRRAARAWAGCGAAGGLALYGYSGARLVPVLVAVLLAAWLLRSVLRAGVRAGCARVAAGAWRLALVGGAMALPLAPAVAHQPGEWTSRLPMVGIFESGWLARETEILGHSAVRILLDQLARSALAFNLYPDAQSHYGSPEPLLSAAAGVLFLLGLGWCTWRWRSPRCLPLVAWWWAGVAASTLTTSPPAAQRLIIVAPPTALIAAVALVGALRAARRALAASRRRRGARSRRAPRVVAVVVAVSIAAHSSWVYFTRYTPSRVFGNPDALVATELGRWARRELTPGSRLLFFGAPRMFVGFATLPFLAPHVEGRDVLEPLGGPPPPELMCGGGATAFAFVPGRIDELEPIRAAVPGGRLWEARGPGGEVVVSVWTVQWTAQQPCTETGVASQRISGQNAPRAALADAERE